MKRTLYTCACSSLEHMFVVTECDEDLFLEVHLRPAPFGERLKRAVRYVFGRRSRYGSFDEIVLTPAMAVELGDQLLNWAQGESVVFASNDVH